MTRDAHEFRLENSVPTTADTDVALDTEISLNFSNPVDTTVLDESFQLSSIESGPVSFTTSTNATEEQVVITPDNDLNASETYLLVVISDEDGEKGLKDEFGTYLDFGTTSVRFSTRSSKFGQINLSEPADRSSEQEPITLQWEEVDVVLEDSTTVADDYDIQVSDRDDFSNLVWTTNTTQTEETIGVDLPDDQTIFWRVRANYSDSDIDITSGWSTVYQFFNGQHVQITQDATGVNIEPLLSQSGSSIQSTISHKDVFTDRYRTVITFEDATAVDDTTVGYDTIYLTGKEINTYNNRPVRWPLSFSTTGNQVEISFLDMSEYDGTDVVINYPLDPTDRIDHYEILWSDQEEAASFSVINTIQANNATGSWTDTNHDSGFYRVKYKDDQGRTYYQSPIFTYNESGGLDENIVYNLEIDGIQSDSGDTLAENNVMSFIFDLFPFYANLDTIKTRLETYNIEFNSDMTLAKYIHDLSLELEDMVGEDDLSENVARLARCFLENSIIGEELIAEYGMTSRGGGFTLGDLSVDGPQVEEIAPTVNDAFRQAKSCRDKIGERLGHKIAGDFDWTMKSTFDQVPPSMTDYQTTWRTWDPLREFKGILAGPAHPNKDWS